MLPGDVSEPRYLSTTRHVLWDKLTCTESSPGRGTPPGDNEAEETPEAWTASLCCPQVDGAGQGERRAYFRNYSCGDERKDACNYEACPVCPVRNILVCGLVAVPVGEVAAGSNASRKRDADTTDEVEGRCIC